MLGLASATGYRVCSLASTGASRRVHSLRLTATHSPLCQSSHQPCSLCGRSQLGLDSLHESRAQRLLLSGTPGAPNARRFRFLQGFLLYAVLINLFQILSGSEHRRAAVRTLSSLKTGIVGLPNVGKVRNLSAALTALTLHAHGKPGTLSIHASMCKIIPLMKQILSF